MKHKRFLIGGVLVLILSGCVTYEDKMVLEQEWKQSIDRFAKAAQQKIPMIDDGVSDADTLAIAVTDSCIREYIETIDTAIALYRAKGMSPNGARQMRLEQMSPKAKASAMRGSVLIYRNHSRNQTTKPATQVHPLFEQMTDADKIAYLESRLSYTQKQTEKIITEFIFMFNERQERFFLTPKKSAWKISRDFGDLVTAGFNHMGVLDKQTGKEYFANFICIGSVQNSSGDDLYVIRGYVGFVSDNSDSLNESNPTAKFIEDNLSRLFDKYYTSKIDDDLNRKSQSIKTDYENDCRAELKTNPLMQ